MQDIPVMRKIKTILYWHIILNWKYMEIQQRTGILAEKAQMRYSAAIRKIRHVLRRRKEIKGCCCGSSCTPEKMAQAEAAKTAPGIKILGSGCAKCNALEEATRTALVELGMEPSIDHITDFAQIAAYGVMTTPALVVDGKVVS